MAQKRTVSGTRSCWLWTIVLLTLAVIGVFAVLVFLVLPLIRGQVEAGQHYTACVNFINSGDCDQAVVECAAVVRLDAYGYYPDSTTLLTQARDCQIETHYQRGLSFMNLGEWQKALAEFQLVLDMDPGYKDVGTNIQEAKSQMAMTGVTPAPSPVPPGDAPTHTPAPVPPAATAIPTDVPTPTQTTVPTDTPTPTTTPPSGPISMSGLDILYREDFSDPQSGWERYWDHRVEYKNGEMVINTSSSRRYYYARPNLNFDDFILEVDSRWSGGAVGGIYGIAFRLEDWDNYYAFHIGNDGRYEIGKMANDKRNVLLEGFSEAINREGGINRFHIEANSHDLRFFINNQSVGSIQDIDHDLGDIVLVARMPEGADFFEASFDNVIVAKYP